MSDNSGSTWDGVPLWYTKEPVVPMPSIFLEIKNEIYEKIAKILWPSPQAQA